MFLKDRLQPATLKRMPVKQFIKACMTDLGLSRADAKRLYNDVPDDVLRNDTYAVFVYKDEAHGFAGSDLWHLSIKRHDKETVHDWRDLQCIKNQVCGVEREGIELYPAESRIMDHANQYHIYVLMTPNSRFPCGYFDDGGRSETSIFNSKNRKFV